MLCGNHLKRQLPVFGEKSVGRNPIWGLPIHKQYSVSKANYKVFDAPAYCIASGSERGRRTEVANSEFERVW